MYLANFEKNNQNPVLQSYHSLYTCVASLIFIFFYLTVIMQKKNLLCTSVPSEWKCAKIVNMSALSYDEKGSDLKGK